jgi:uncharacterized protein
MYGPLMSHQCGGCCDASTPMCYPAGESLTGKVDTDLGDLRVEGVSAVRPLCMSRAQYEYCRHTHLTADVVEGRRSGFSVQTPERVRFLLRSPLMSQDEMQALELR